MLVMDTDKTIKLLRFALAAVWTECERDQPENSIISNCQIICDEALKITIEHAKAKTFGGIDGTGLESWREYIDIK